MTWWWQTVRAAWDRWDEWQQRLAEDRAWQQDVHDRNEQFDGSWVDEIRPPEDFANGIFDPVTRPGRRYTGPPRHAKPKTKVPVVTFRYGDGEPK